MEELKTVIAEGTSSVKAAIPSGVSQGSAIAPSLFAAFIDPLLTATLPSTTHPLFQVLFADDFLGVKVLRDRSDECELQLELDGILQIIRNLGLSVNVAKSAILVCSLAPRPPVLEIRPSINGSEIPIVNELKYLGVILDRKLAFNRNAQITASKAKRIIGVLWAQVGKFAGSEAFHILCTAKLMPVLSYCLPVVAPKSERDFAVLEKVNRFALHLLKNDYTSSYQDLLRNANVCSVAQRLFSSSLILVHKYMHSLRNYSLSLNVPTSARRSQRHHPPHDLQIAMPYFRHKSCDSFPLFRSFRLWNGLQSGSWGNIALVLELVPIKFRKAVLDTEFYYAMSDIFPFYSVSVS